MSDRHAYHRVFREFRAALEAGQRPDVRVHWSSYDGARGHELLVELVEQEIFYRILKGGEALRIEDYGRRFPELSKGELEELLVKKQEYERRRFESRQAGPADGSTPPEADHPSLAGYVNWEFHKSGGMGEIWLATSVRLKRRVAIKAPQAAALNAETRARVFAEAQAAARCKHPNLCTVFDVLEHDDRVYICMEYVQGRTLDEWAKAEPKPTARDMAQKLALVARAAQAVHEQEYVHRDIKPANVMIEDGAEGRPVLLDFGLARPSTHEVAPQTRGAYPEGTPAFLAPEQVLAHAIGPATDVHALGATLYALLTGTLPFALDSLLRRIVEEPPAFPPQLRQAIHPDLRAICLKALAKAPEDRYASAAALAQDLDRFARGDPVSARSPGSFRRLGLWARKHASLVAVAAVLLMAVVPGWIAYRAWERGQLLTRLAELSRAAALSQGDRDEVETLLGRLEAIDDGLANDQREKYVERLLQLDPTDLTRLEHSVLRLTDRDPARAERLRQSGAWERFQRVALPYIHFGSLYSFLRPNPERITNLERVVRIEARLRPSGASAAAESELLKAYLVRGDLAKGDLARAELLATELLDRDNLSPAWRLTVLRDYVWLAIWTATLSGDQAKLAGASARVDAALGQESKYRSEYLPLLVEKARLLAAQERPGDADRVLKEYFDSDLRLQLDAKKTPDPRLGDGPDDNVPARFFLDGCLLQGFLRERLSGAKEERPRAETRLLWAKAADEVRGTHVGAYYEGAMLESLVGRLEVRDAIAMVTHTASSARSLGKSPVLAEIEEEIRRRSKLEQFSAVGLLATVLRNTWVSKHGYDYARRIAFRQISFGEYLHVQIRLWTLEGLRLAVEGNRKQGGVLTSEQEDLLWRLTRDVHSAFTAGTLDESALVELVRIGLDPRNLAVWPRRATHLPGHLRGAVAYVLYRHYRLNLGRPNDARQFLADILRHVKTFPNDATLRVLLGKELQVYLQGFPIFPVRF